MGVCLKLRANRAQRKSLSASALFFSLNLPSIAAHSHSHSHSHSSSFVSTTPTHTLSNTTITDTPSYPHPLSLSYLPTLPCSSPHHRKYALTDISPIRRKNHLHLHLIVIVAASRYIRKDPCRLYRHPFWRPCCPHWCRCLHRLGHPRLPWPARHLHPQP